MNYSCLSEVELLGCVVGRRTAARLYQGALAPLFAEGEEPKGREKLLAARELVGRMLAEEMRRESVLSSPSAARDYMRLLFRGRDYEAFLVFFLDARHRVLASEELFRGTLSQTSVYSPEIVTRALANNCAAVVCRVRTSSRGDVLP